MHMVKTDRKRFDISYKNEMVERYLELKASSNMSAAEYCRINDLSDSTFNRWLMIYRRSLDEVQRNSTEIVTLSPSSGFIPLSQSDIEEAGFNKTVEPSSSKMTLTIAGAEISFSKDQLTDVIKALKGLC